MDPLTPLAVQASPSFAALVPVVVLFAALLHASWNAVAHAITDRLLGFALINLAYLLFAIVSVCFVPVPPAAAWPFMAGSAALQVFYQLMLLQAYKLGDFGQMYPIARGTSPWVVAVAATLLLGQALPGGELAGVLVISAGLIGLTLANGVPGRSHLPALSAALGTGVLIACCTLLDGVGVRRSDTVPGYVAWTLLLQAPVIPLIAFAVRRRSLLTELRPVAARGLIGGVLSLSGYGLVVWAQAHGSLAGASALRETSIVFAALIGSVIFRERLGRVRLAASATVLAGIVLLNAGFG
ncbi:EamA family transporter [Streptomyces sp. NPDC040724]|uniref:EamA family transporter n=1 Tax=Streptomyces sp. NPDC040724 TaxID=3155612 RepID=UPI003407D50A